MKHKITLWFIILLSTVLFTTARTNIDPLVKVNWNQTYPYNILTPGDYPVGCGALAMAMIMSTLQYPDDYNWELITQGDTLEIATLIRDCGIANKTSYGVSSSCKDVDLFTSFVTYFGYPETMVCPIRNYHPDDWEDIIYNSLENGSPVLMTSYSDYGGHAYVCDGYMDGLFHINWGWGGTHNGFYNLFELIPDNSGISYNSSVKAGVMLSAYDRETTPLVYRSINFKNSRDVYSRRQRIYFDGYIFSETAWDFYGSMGVKLSSLSGDVIYVEVNSNLRYTFNYGNLVYIVDTSELPNGRYYIDPVFCYNGIWQDVVCYPDSKRLFVIIDDNTITFTEPPTTDLYDVNTDYQTGDDWYISVDGMKWKHPTQKGVYIKNGKTVYIK